MNDLGEPTSYVVLEAGTPVYSSDGKRIGAVHHVLAAEAQDIFDGIVIGDTEPQHLPGGGHRFVDAPEVAAIHEHGVTLSIDAAACRELPRPTANPEATALKDQPSGLSGKLGRAWDRLSGNG